MKSKFLQLLIFHFIFFIIFSPFLCSCLETDTITSTTILRDPDTIVSNSHAFKLGFFTPENTTSRYLGVFYTVSEKTIIWVANRDQPLNDSSSFVTISENGNLVLVNAQNQTVWSTNLTTSGGLNSTSLQIQNTGNLILRENPTGTIIWQSFSTPSDVFMPTMRITDNTNTGEKIVVSSWKNGSDPEMGIYTAGLEALSIPQIFTWKNGRPYWRSGPWNGQILMGVQDMYSPYLDGFSVVDDRAGYIYFTAPEARFYMKITLNSSGNLVQTLWDDQRRIWDVTWLAPQHECDVYGTCGPYGSCNIDNSPVVCGCLDRFEPNDPQGWQRGDWSGGCARRTPLNCSTGDGFLKYSEVKLPDTMNSWFNESMSVEECEDFCSRNCSCTAYTHIVEGGNGCLFWFGELVDIRKVSPGANIYIRMARSELGKH